MSIPDLNPDLRGRGPIKSATAYRTISEVAEQLAVPQHVLRFWETKFSQIRPLKRGGGRRYYRPEDVLLLRRIKKLLYEQGYTIKGVQKLLREARADVKAADPADEDLFGTPDSPDSAASAAAGEMADSVDPSADPSAHPSAHPSAASRLPEDVRGQLIGVLEELRQLRKLLRG